MLTPYADNDVDALTHVTAFQQALQKLGWSEGRSVRIDVRWGAGNIGRIQAHAIDLVALKPDVILAVSSQALQPLQRRTSSTPIVFTQIADPVGSGFVASLAHPGGNITGFTPAEFSLYGKSLEVLKEIAPQVTRVAIALASPARNASRRSMARLRVSAFIQKRSPEY